MTREDAATKATVTVARRPAPVSDEQDDVLNKLAGDLADRCTTSCEGDKKKLSTTTTTSSSSDPTQEEEEVTETTEKPQQEQEQQQQQGQGSAEVQDDQQHQQQQQEQEEQEQSQEQETKDEDCILFIGDLARGLCEADLEQAFSSVGKVVMVDIKRDKLTMRNLGYAFVQMSTREEAEEAKERMHEVEIQGRRIRVGWAQRNTALFIGDLEETMTIEDLHKLFGKFGTLQEEYSYLRVGRWGKFGSVKFETRQDAEVARREMNGLRLGASAPFPIRVVWHHPQTTLITTSGSTTTGTTTSISSSSSSTYKNLDGSAQGPPFPSAHYPPPSSSSSSAFFHHQHTRNNNNNVTIMTHVPPPPPPGAPISSRPYSVHVQFEAGVNEALVNEALLHGIFAPFGEVIAVVLPQGPGILASEGEGVNGACRRGYGFIHFTGSALGRQCAIEAIQTLQGQYVNGVRLQCAFSKKPGGPPRQPFMPSRGGIRGMPGGGRGGNGGGGGGGGGPGPAVVMHFHHHPPYAGGGGGGGELPPNNNMHMPMSMHMPPPGAIYTPHMMMMDPGSGSPSSVMNMGMGGPMGGGGPPPLPPGGGGGFFVDHPKMGNGGGGGGGGVDGGGNGNTPNGRWIPPAASQQHQHQHQGYRPDTPQLGGPSPAGSYASPPGGMYGNGPAAGPYGYAPYPDMQQQQQSVPPLPPHHRHPHHHHHNHHNHHHDHHLNQQQQQQQQQHVPPEYFVEQAPYDAHMYPYHYYDNDPYMQQQHHPHHPHHHSPLAPGGGVENLDGGAGMPHSAPYLPRLLTSNSSIGGEDMMMYGGMYMEAFGP